MQEATTPASPTHHSRWTLSLRDRLAEGRPGWGWGRAGDNSRLGTGVWGHPSEPPGGAVPGRTRVWGGEQEEGCSRRPGWAGPLQIRERSRPPDWARLGGARKEPAAAGHVASGTPVTSRAPGVAEPGSAGARSGVDAAKPRPTEPPAGGPAGGCLGSARKSRHLQLWAGALAAHRPLGGRACGQAAAALRDEFGRSPTTLSDERLFQRK